MSLDHEPAEILRQLLVDLGLGSLPESEADWPAYAISTPDTPDNMISVLGTTGQRLARMQLSGEIAEYYGCQILIRSATNQAGFAKAQAIAQALDIDVYDATVNVQDEEGTGTGTYLVHSVNRVNGPLPLGTEAGSKRCVFSINVMLDAKQAT